MPTPVLEWYLPTFLYDPSMRLDSTKSANKLEQFQQECLAAVLGVPPTVSRDKLNKIMCEKTVKEKARLVATRMAGFCERDVQLLKWEDGVTPVYPPTRSVVLRFCTYQIQFSNQYAND